MNKIEAKQILKQEIEELKKKSYDELRRYLGSEGVETKTVKSSSGKKYNIEIQAYWDDKPGHNLRLLVSIDDGGWRSFFPISDDFILAPGGSLLGE